jgi:YD repeat-containing protein
VIGLHFYRRKRWELPAIPTLSQQSVYDAAGQRINLVDPDGGVRTYTWDMDGRLQLYVDTLANQTTLQYDAAARKTTATYASGLQRQWTYDAASQIVSIIDQDSLGDLQARFTFAYDGVGNRTGIIDLIGSVTTYQMDAKNQQIGDDTTGTNAHAYSYSYDGTGNRLMSNEGGVVTISSYSPSNRLVTSTSTLGSATYTYSANGALILIQAASGTTTMAYDNENRLVLNQSAGVTSTYQYSGDSLKRVEQVAGATTTLVWNGSNYLQGRN